MSRPLIAVCVGLVLVLLGSGVWFWFVRTQSPRAIAGLVYTYPAEVYAHVPRASPARVTWDDIRRVDREAFRIVSRAALSEDAAVRVYTGLVAAEYDFIALSELITGDAHGSIVPIAQAVLCEAVSDACGSMQLTASDRAAFTDPFTTQLTNTVMHARAAEKDTLPGKAFPAYAVESVDEAAYSAELAAIPNTVDTLTDDQTRAAVFWLGGTGTRAGAGIWLDALDDYVGKLPLSFDAQVTLRTRAFLAAAHAYTDPVTYSGSSTSALTRPAGLIPRVVTSAPTYYPSRTVAFSAALGAVLSPALSGFPDIAKDFTKELQESHDAHVWSGIYTRSDVRAGEVLGAAEGALVERGEHSFFHTNP